LLFGEPIDDAFVDAPVDNLLGGGLTGPAPP
jgi:hypothetical protein